MPEYIEMRCSCMKRLRFPKVLLILMMLFVGAAGVSYGYWSDSLGIIARLKVVNPPKTVDDPLVISGYEIHNGPGSFDCDPYVRELDLTIEPKNNGTSLKIKVLNIGSDNVYVKEVIARGNASREIGNENKKEIRPAEEVKLSTNLQIKKLADEFGNNFTVEFRYSVGSESEAKHCVKVNINVVSNKTLAADVTTGDTIAVSNFEDKDSIGQDKNITENKPVNTEQLKSDITGKPDDKENTEIKNEPTDEKNEDKAKEAEDIKNNEGQNRGIAKTEETGALTSEDDENHEESKQGNTGNYETIEDISQDAGKADDDAEAGPDIEQANNEEMSENHDNSETE